MKACGIAVSNASPSAIGSNLPLSIGPTLSSEAFTQVRRRMALDYCKWDPQVGDHNVLMPFPLIITSKEWARLGAWSEQLASEALKAEQLLSRHKDVIGHLAMPRCLRRVLSRLSNQDFPK